MSRIVSARDAAIAARDNEGGGEHEFTVTLKRARQRSGGFLPSEDNFIAELIHAFRTGYLDCPVGVKLPLLVCLVLRCKHRRLMDGPVARDPQRFAALRLAGSMGFREVSEADWDEDAHQQTNVSTNASCLVLLLSASSHSRRK